jgi:hypothetical protein
MNGGASNTGASSAGGVHSGGSNTGGVSGGLSAGASGAGGASGGASAGGSSAGQAGTTATGGQPAVSFAQVEVIVGNNCSGCHVNRRPIFTTTGATLYSTLTSTVVKECGNHKLVTAGNTGTSALIELVTNKCNGFRMPTSCSSDLCVVQEDLGLLSAWISAGAKGP